MDFNRIYEDDAGVEFFYNNKDYPGKKLVVGIIDLEYAIKRLEKQEYYTLVMYKEGDELPSGYVPLDSLTSEDGTLFATYDPNLMLYYICKKGGIQKISVLSKPGSDNPEYLLGPGDDTITQKALINISYDYYKKLHLDKEKGKNI